MLSSLLSTHQIILDPGHQEVKGLRMNSGAQQSKATTPLQSQLQFQGHYKVECVSTTFHMEVIVNREKQANTFTLEDYGTFTKPLTITSETNVYIPSICMCA